MANASVDFIHLFKKAGEKHSLKNMFRHWLSKEQLADGENMLGVHYMDAVSNPAKRAAVLKKLSPQAYALLAVLRNCQGLRYKIDPEAPSSPLSMLDQGQEKNYTMNCCELQFQTSAYSGDLNLDHIAELHYYGVAFFTDPALWPPGTFTEDHFAGDIVLAPGFESDEIALPQKVVGSISGGEQPENVNTEFSGKMCRWLDSFMSLAEKGHLRYSGQHRFYAFSRDMLEKHFVNVDNRDLLFEYILRFGMDSGLLCMDSSGVIAPGPELPKFRLLPLGSQMIKYVEWRNTCPSVLVKENDSLRTASLELFLVCAYNRLLKANHGKWLSTEEVLAELERSLHSCCSAGGAKKLWGWEAVRLNPITKEELRDFFSNELRFRFFIPGLTYHGSGRDGKAFVTLTELGEAFNGLAPVPSYDSSKTQLVVKNDFEIILINSGRWDYVRYFLSLFTEMAPNSTHDSSVFHLKQKTIREAVAAGRPVTMLIDFLKEHATAPIPLNVITTLKDWVVSEVTLHKDACFFAFDNPRDAANLLAKHPKSFSLIGDRMLLCYMSDESIMKLMNSNRINAVDYSIPASGAITVTMDNEVVFNNTLDFRIKALGLMIAEEIVDRNGKKRYTISHDKLAAMQNPKVFYQRLSRVFSPDTSIVTKLRIMRAMGLIPSRGPVTVLLNCPTKTKQQLQSSRLSWYRSFSCQIGLGQFVVKEECVAEVRQALSQITDKRAVLQTFPTI
ncbi:hypothetical protein IKW72_00855 [bacterium]|nr:hypothetical protein [bacterium]